MVCRKTVCHDGNTFYLSGMKYLPAIANNLKKNLPEQHLCLSPFKPLFSCAYA